MKESVNLLFLVESGNTVVKYTHTDSAFETFTTEVSTEKCVFSNVNISAKVLCLY